MILTTNYLGLRLRSPLVAGAGPLTAEMDTARKLEDAGVGAIVMPSLFEEQVQGEQYASIYRMEQYAGGYSEVGSYFPQRSDFRLTPEQYVQRVARLKEALAVPVIASLNGTTRGEWLEYAGMMQQAGADAIELNVYYLPTDVCETGEAVEKRLVDVLADVRAGTTLPIAVKLSPYFSGIPNLIYRLQEAGANGFVLFNRLYHPDISLDEPAEAPRPPSPDRSELRLRLLWLTIVSSQVSTSLAASGGVYTAQDALQTIAAGANVVQMVSALLRHGPEHVKTVTDGILAWMQENGQESLWQVRNSANLSCLADPSAFERGAYMRTLQRWSK
jgi:dihydroorotate dehydrogenase (fumarate)